MQLIVGGRQGKDMNENRDRPRPLITPLKWGLFQQVCRDVRVKAAGRCAVLFCINCGSHTNGLRCPVCCSDSYQVPWSEELEQSVLKLHQQFDNIVRNLHAAL